MSVELSAYASLRLHVFLSLFDFIAVGIPCVVILSVCQCVCNYTCLFCLSVVYMSVCWSSVCLFLSKCVSVYLSS